MTPSRWASLLIGVLFVLIAVTSVRAGDEDCRPTPATIWHPAGTEGCTLDGPTTGKASTYPGEVAAAQWCTWPFQGCTTVTVQSHQTGVTIVVTPQSFCQCYWMTDRRLIDLTPAQVRALGLDPRDGIFAVTVTPVAGGSRGGAMTSEASGAHEDNTAHRLPDTSMGGR